MDENWPKIEALFLQALDLDSDVREQWVRQQTTGNPTLCQRVLELLHADREEAFLLDRPVTAEAQREAEAHEALLGQRLGAYRVVERLGEGGMALVYRAVRDDDRYEAEVAIKVSRRSAASSAALASFDAECRTLARLDHPNIARLLDAGTTASGAPFLVMEQVRGRPLIRYAEEEQLDVVDRLRLFAIVCRTVQFAHQNLVVHRDLKPSNILVTDDGVPKLLDFGIATVLHGTRGSGDGDGACRSFTPEYASPEQWEGGPHTTSTDVFSLGVILYRLLTGASPFVPDGGEPLEQAGGESEVVAPSQRVADRARAGAADGGSRKLGRTARTRAAELRGDLDCIVLRALRRDPSERYPSAEQFAEDLERHLAGLPVRARGDSFLYRTRRFVARNRWSSGLAALAATALFTSTAVSVYYAREANRGWDAAEAEAARVGIEAASAKHVCSFVTEAFLSSTELRPADTALARHRLELQADHIRHEFPHEPALRAKLFDGLGRAALALRLIDLAEALFEESRRLGSERYSETSLEVALSLEGVGRCQWETGDLRGAIETFERRLELHERFAGDQAADVAAAANDLGVLLHRVGELSRALELHRRALKLRQVGSGEQSSLFAESLNNVAAVLQDLGELEEAAVLLDRCLEIRRRSLGEFHPLTAQAVANQAVLMHRMGEFERAREGYDQALEAYALMRSAGREGRVHTLTNRAQLAVAEGAFSDAERDLREAREICEESYSADALQKVPILLKLAQVRTAQRRFGEALEHVDQSLAILGRAEGALPQRKALALQHRGNILLSLEREDEARTALFDALDTLEQTESPDLRTLGFLRVSIGMCFARQGLVEDAVAWIEEGRSILERSAPIDAPELVLAREELATIRGSTPGDGSSSPN